MKTNENFQLSTFNFQPNKRLAVVILNWNGRALIEEFLPSVVAYTPGEWADVIVADNGSTDDSIEMLKTKFPTVGIIRLDKNYGFAEGYNQALKHIGHEYTVLLNSDVEVTPGWLDAPVAAMDADKTIAGVQPKIRAQRNKEYFEYAGAAGGYIFSLTSEPIPERCITSLLKKYCGLLGILYRSSHKVRKTYGSSLLEGGVSINTTRIMLGHSDEKTTLKYYCFDTHTEAEKVNLLEDALKMS